MVPLLPWLTANLSSGLSATADARLTPPISSAVRQNSGVAAARPKSARSRLADSNTDPGVLSGGDQACAADSARTPARTPPATARYRAARSRRDYGYPATISMLALLYPKLNSSTFIHPDWIRCSSMTVQLLLKPYLDQRLIWHITRICRSLDRVKKMLGQPQ